MTPLPASLTIAELGAPGAELRTVEALLAANGGGVSLDASSLRDFDSSAIALLLEVRRQARATGRSFAIEGVPVPMVELASLYGVAELLGPAPTQTAPGRSQAV